ncbi:hypothetical protein Pmar_PMAR023959 [Perkinsus marinus ATCC 50983]|uniref:N-acetyltransferase domain-containing protein n=1 Tax=Perkinsus marinus (strain ATCC 50983 / TXsc) TaxID=423536 RepID=C5LQB3_PERM5|nr:hypothetical protein Pmar_PMAR023959 [Perkinsus marinus ATCC 50983]EER01081.1 hypothetical protein Pmar_PMAR023959 [Perkinsus marinus ATCC 50983]|eukprot:XP_002768363.1 hypothetical protein Pmar_PMAR023959 [Perkinsus marinus ATCC 50983]
MVVGVLDMAIPKPYVPSDVKGAIEARRPSGCKNPGGAIGGIYKLVVAQKWKNEGVEAKVLSEALKDVRRLQPNWDVIYIWVLRANYDRIALYEKSRFIKILDKRQDSLVAYARYNT